jgi:uncharacterized membrane protein
LSATHRNPAHLKVMTPPKAPEDLDLPAARSRGVPRVLHPLNGILLAFPVGLFPGALAADVTYLNSSEMQWSNFAAWLIAAALVFTGVSLAWALVRAYRAGSLRLAGVLAALFVIGLMNAFQHSHDGWSSVGTTGLVLSLISTVLALAAGWIGYTVPRELRA